MPWKLITLLFPFLRELIVGKYSENKRFRSVKIMFIIISLISITSNYYLLKSAWVLSKEKITLQNKITELNKKIDDELAIINSMSVDATGNHNVERNINDRIQQVGGVGKR